MAMKNPTQSVYEIPHNNDARNRTIADIMSQKKIIMVKGIGYIVVNKGMEDPALFRHMGEVVAKAYEDE